MRSLFERHDLCPENLLTNFAIFFPRAYNEFRVFFFPQIIWQIWRFFFSRLFDKFSIFFSWDHLTNYVIFRQDHSVNYVIFSRSHLSIFTGVFFPSTDWHALKMHSEDGVKSTVFACLLKTFTEDEKLALFLSHFSLFFLWFNPFSLFFKSDSPLLHLKPSKFQNVIFGNKRTRRGIKFG